MIRLLRLERADPLFDLPSSFRFRHAIAFFDLANQHLDIAFDLLYVVMRKFAPLVAHASASSGVGANLTPPALPRPPDRQILAGLAGPPPR